MPDQLGERLDREGHRAALLVLRRPLGGADPLAASQVPVRAHRERRPLDVEIGPAQPAQLAPTAAREGGETQQGAEGRAPASTAFR